MDYIQAIVLAIVQGITEWLPISSSAHLAITNRIFQINANLFYYVILHLATLCSLLLYFRKDLVKYWIDKKGKLFLSKKAWFTIYASIPIFLAGYFLHDLIEAMFVNFKLIGAAMIVNAAILFSTTYFKNEKDLTLRKSIAIGLMQMFALIPGISRSGITVSSGFFAKLKKEELILFSMMLAIPAIAGATAYQLVKSYSFIIMQEIPIMLLGFVVAVLCGYFALSVLIKSIKNGLFYDYWFYCLIIGLVMIFN